MMDELHESGCIAQKGQSEEARQKMGLSGCEGLSGIVRSVGGICTGNDMDAIVMSVTTSQPVRGNAGTTGSGTPSTRKVYIKGDSSGRFAYAIIGDAEVLKSTASSSSSTRSAGLIGGSSIPAGQADKYYTLSSEPVFKSKGDKECYDEGKPLTYSEWKTKYGKTEFNGVEKQQYVNSAVFSKVCGDQKDQVVDPTSGIIRSFQCVCLSAMVSYLLQWKAVLVLARTCFQEILLTGDGTAGSCRAFISEQLCDLFCVANRHRT